jgi:hypothetical protein
MDTMAIINATWIAAFITISLAGILFCMMIINGLRNWRRKRDLLGWRGD